MANDSDMIIAYQKGAISVFLLFSCPSRIYCYSSHQQQELNCKSTNALQGLIQGGCGKGRLGEGRVYTTNRVSGHKI